jgi:hypothetical protein
VHDKLCFDGGVKRPTITDAASMALGLQDEIRRSEESRYGRRLHGVLLVAQGMRCPDVAGLLGDAPRSVENWVRRFEKRGLVGLREGERFESELMGRQGSERLDCAGLRRQPGRAAVSAHLSALGLPAA